MADQRKVVIVGGHGKIALLAAPKLVEAGFSVESIIRNPEQAEEVTATGASPVVLDVESADSEALAEVFSGAEAVVFSAGAGGGNPARTKAVDQDAAIRTMDAAAQAGVSRYVMVSYARSEVDIHQLDPESSFYPYAAAKHHADNHLRGTELQYTILGPGALTTEPATRQITVVDADSAAEASSEGGKEAVSTSRANVAEVISHVLTADVARRSTVNFFDGETPIAEAIR
ncbi:SDR family oxidoreductase [Nesterenkonia natronophila]|uniref:SDR family oxidoreductase n=1 Tax=Nesterenkonia natronophila TaxID=2174932 RepID=A0A3A4F054_9MICC|nr:SDR family oxidoreductase [Nesterenkonia natronophila]RJN31542.1 SDR family oxidoreductase [Nesterenkonia natronophila]